MRSNAMDCVPRSMKAVLLLFTVLATLAPALAAENPKQKPIAAAAGAEFEIKLPSDLRSDYQWLLAKPVDPGLLKFVRRSFKRPTPGAANATGTEVLTFKALAEGETSVHLKYGQVRAQSAASDRSTNVIIRISRPAPNQQK